MILQPNEIRNICNVMTCANLALISIIFLFLYFVLKKYDTVNMYLCLGAICLVSILYIVSRYFIAVKPVFYGPPITFIIVFLLVILNAYFIVSLLKIPKLYSKILYISSFLILIPFLLSLSSLILGYSFYNQTFLIPCALISLLLLTIITIATSIYIINEYRNVEGILSFIALIIILYSGAIFGSLIPRSSIFNQNYIFFNLAVIIFTIILIYRLSSNYAESVSIRRTLEKKVEERTIDLQILNNHLKKANQEKTYFFIKLAHETKGPLTLINNYLDSYIKGEKIDNDNIRVVKYNIEKLTKDMVNFLDAEKIEKGVELYNHDKIFNLSDMVKNQVLLTKPSANKKKIRITSKVDNNVLIKASDVAVNRIIRNILENAVKYTENNGEISVDLKSSNNNIILSISDTGIGISEENLETIFDPFYHANGRKMNYQGMGLGLMITKNIIESLNGSINITSNLNEGTIVNIIMIQHDLKESERVENYNPLDNPTEIPVFLLKESQYNPNKKTILLVDDNHAILSMLIEELKPDYNVLYAEDGNEALQKLSTYSPDVIISDVMMDKMDGNEFYNNIPKEYRNIPFIFLTGKHGISEKITALEKGAIDYIYKPFSMDEVKAKIKNHLQQKNIIRNEMIKKISTALNENEISKKTKEQFFAEKKISSSEKKVIYLILKDKLIKEIASELSVSESTVKNHITKIYKKISCKNRSELVEILSNFV